MARLVRPGPAVGRGREASVDRLGLWRGGRVAAVLWLRDRRHEDPAAFEEFVALGLIALSYGLALARRTRSASSSVFASGVALRRIEARRAKESAPAAMVGSALGFVERTERIAEVVAVLMLGAMLSALTLDWRPVALGTAADHW